MVLPVDQLTLPLRPAAPPPVRFPVIASVAPLAVAGVIWAMTGSAFTLVFAILGPVIAVATMIDGRRTSRARLRTDTSAHAEAVDALRRAVERRHDDLRRAAWAHTPAASTILDSPDEGGRWQRPTATAVTLGSGTVFGGLLLAGPVDTPENRDLRQWAAALTEAPLAVDPRGGIGIAGPITLSRAFARGLLVQLCFAIPPGRCAPPRLPAAGWEWAAALPHADARSPSPAIVISEGPGFDPTASDSAPDRFLIALAGTVGELPPGCETIVRVQGPGRAEIVRSTAHAWATEFRPELVSTADAARFAGRLRAAALAIGLVAQRPLPHSVALAELLQNREQGPAEPAVSLEASLGVGEQGDFSLDLVAAGPHAVVGGTTGSGKSELLVTWVASLASSYSPAQVTFLLVDFKGGSAFGPLTDLPHCVGLITDLDQGEAGRALRSLAAELRYREEVLRGAGARDIGQLGPAAALPRLVIVVDEFATMLDAFPELHARFVDIAARGRSLGVHLILCTQRPAGVVRDALLANCSLRLSLRVNNRADSIAVIGTDAAARLAPDQPGRCLVETPGGGTRLCQVATTAEGDIRAIADAASAGPVPRRPWLAPLPAVVTMGELRAAAVGTAAAIGTGQPGGGYLLGLLDEPDRQRHRVADYRPARDGNLLVVGGAGSGKSSLLASLAAQESDASATVSLITPDVEVAWDALQSASGELSAARGHHARLLLFDDLDSVWARWEPEYRIAAAELLAGLLRDGRAGGLHLVITVQRIAGLLQALPGLCQSALWLRLSSRAEHAAAGGDNALFDPALPPGGGTWQGSRIQVPLPEPGRCRETPEAVTPSVLELPAPPTTLIVVSGSPARSALALRSAFQGRRAVVDIAAAAREATGSPEVAGDAGGAVFVGDAESWQAQWALFSALRPGAGIVFDGCGLAEFRMISRRRDMPPPLAPGRGHVWMLRPDGTLIRASLPAAAPRG